MRKEDIFFMVSFSDLLTYTLVIIAIITLCNSNRKEKQPPRPEKTSDYFLALISEQPLLLYGSPVLFFVTY